MTDQWRNKGKARPCKTPHLTEDEIKAAFVRMVNKLAAERGPLIADLREIQKTYSVTAELERTLRELDERMNTEADAVQDLIATNARVAQNQDPKCDEDYIAEEITRLQGEKQAIYVEASERIDIKANINNMIEYINGRVEETEAYDEALTRNLISKVTIYDKYCVVEFKSGVEATIEK